MTLTPPTYVDDRLAHWAEHDPDGEAITYLGRTWTWSERDDRVRRVAGGLQALGIGRGDVPTVMEVAIIGVPDDTGGESVKAVVSLKEGASATEEELIAHCREHLAAFKCPRSVDIIELLPRNPTGKILKRELRKPYWEGRDRQVV